MGNPIVHIEIPAEDAKKSAEFYSELFGWEFDWSYSEDYPMFGTGANPSLEGGAIYEPMENGPTETMFYIGVDDIDGKLREIEKRGGETVTKKTEIEGGHGWYGAFRDLNGNIVGLYTYPPRQPEE